MKLFSPRRTLPHYVIRSPSARRISNLYKTARLVRPRLLVWRANGSKFLFLPPDGDFPYKGLRFFDVEDAPPDLFMSQKY